MTLYSKDGSFPSQLPERIRMLDGSTRTDSSTFTEEEIIEAGYVFVEKAPTYSYPQKLLWDGLNWVVSDPTEQDTTEQWSSVRMECIKRLTETDYKVIKSVEIGESPDPDVVIYRQSLRDIYNNINNIDPWFVEWPTKP